MAISLPGRIQESTAGLSSTAPALSRPARFYPTDGGADPRIKTQSEQIIQDVPLLWICSSRRADR